MANDLTGGVYFGGLRGPSPSDYRPLAAAWVGDVNIDATVARYVWPLPRLQFQSHAGACVAHGFSLAAEAAALVGGATVQLCRQDLYFGARWLRGWEHEDGGCLITDMARWMREYGTLSEVIHPWNPDDVTTWRPPSSLDAERRAFTCDYQPLGQTLTGLLTELAANRAIPFGHWVTPQMVGEAGQTGRERWHEGMGQVGAHCRAIVGYDPDDGFLIQNSWQGWGVHHPEHAQSHPRGFSWAPVDVVLNPGWGFDFHRLVRPLPVET